MKLFLPLMLCALLAVPELPVIAATSPTQSTGKRRHKRARVKRKAVTVQPSPATAADLQQLIRSFSDADVRAELARRMLPVASLPALEEEAERRKLVSFTDKEIRAELNRRLLTAYSLDKLLAEAERRGIQ